MCNCFQKTGPWIVVVLAACACSTALAQTDPARPVDRPGDPVEKKMPPEERSTIPADLRIQKATDLIGKKVKNSANEDLGEIQELTIDPDRSRVVYAVVAFGGFMGMGEKFFAIPMSAFTLSHDAKHFVLNVDKDRLKNAQGFDKNHWPDMADSAWSSGIYTYYGQKPYWETDVSQKPKRWQKASDLVGKKVRNNANEDLGEIQDLAIDPDRGRVAYAVVAFGGFMGMGEKWFAIPMATFTLPSDAKHFVLSADKDRLKSAEGFDKGRWPNMADSRWATNVHTYYNQRPYWEEK